MAERSRLLTNNRVPSSAIKRFIVIFFVELRFPFCSHTASRQKAKKVTSERKQGVERVDKTASDNSLGLEQTVTPPTLLVLPYLQQTLPHPASPLAISNLVAEMNKMTDQPTVIDSTTDAATVAKIEALLRPVAKFKERSYETSKAQHLPVFSSLVAASSSSSAPASGTFSVAQSSPPKISVVLLGDSMLERMLTTGLPHDGPSLPCLGDWPPSKLMSDASLEAALAQQTLGKSPASRLPNVLNLGVGGDRIQNVAYRMIGQPSDSAKSLEGYAPYLVQLRSVELWVVQAGTNNLRPKTGLSDQDISALEQLLRALLIIPSNGHGDASSRILLTGLFKRSDVSKEIIQASNQKLNALVEKLNGVQDPEIGGDRVVYMPTAKAIGDEDDFFVDHVHLNLQGYQQWMKELVPGVYSFLGKCEEA